MDTDQHKNSVSSRATLRNTSADFAFEADGIGSDAIWRLFQWWSSEAA